MPSQVRLSTGAGLPDGDIALYHLLGSPSPKPTSSVGLLLQSDCAKCDRPQLTVKQNPQQQALALVQNTDRGVSGSPGPTASYDRQAKQEQSADKENMLMGLCIPRFNIIEASQITRSELGCLVRIPSVPPILQRALVLAVKGKLTKQAYKFLVRGPSPSLTALLSAQV